MVLRTLAQIYLSRDQSVLLVPALALVTVAHVLMMSNLDEWNISYMGLSLKDHSSYCLSRIQQYRYGFTSVCYVIPIVCMLHWLLVGFWMQFKAYFIAKDKGMYLRKPLNYLCWFKKIKPGWHGCSLPSCWTLKHVFSQLHLSCGTAWPPSSRWLQPCWLLSTEPRCCMSYQCVSLCVLQITVTGSVDVMHISTDLFRILLSLGGGMFKVVTCSRVTGRCFTDKLLHS